MVDKDIHILPDDFHLGNEGVIIHFYSSNKSSEKNKVIFTKNMFCLLEQGVKEVQTATEHEIVTNQEILMLTSGSVLMTERMAENSQYKAILIFFDNKILLDFCTKKKLFQDQNVESCSIFKIFKDDFLKNFSHSLKLLHKENNTEMNDLKVQEILSYISSKHPEVFQKFVKQALTNTKNVKLKQIVELNSHKGLTIEEFAFLCNMSISTFKRHFAEIYNMSPQKYFTNLKMEQAKSLLYLYKRPSEIYLELGYENLSAFSNEFKKYSGLSPKQFQSKNGLLAKTFELSE